MAAITDFASANRLGPQSRGLIFLLGALTGLTALSIDMSLPALPTLAASLHTSVDQAALTLSMFLAGYSVSQLFYGPLSDRYGRRPLLLAGLVLFTAGGIGCALAPNIGQLIEWRLVQGLGACAGPILARALVRDLYQSERGIQILSYMTLVMSVAPLLAPILGGYLLTLHWRAIFVALSAIALVMLGTTWVMLPEGVPENRRQRVQARALLRNLADFFRRRACNGGALVASFAFCGVFSYVSGSAFVLIEVFGISSAHFGYLFGLNAFGLMVGALSNARFVHRIGSRIILLVGTLAMLGSGAAMLTSALSGLGGIAGIVGPMVVYVMGMGMVMPNAIAAAMEPVPHMAGFASSIIGCLQTASGSLAGFLLGLAYNRSAVPMATAVALSASLAALSYFGLLARSQPASSR